MRLIKPKLMRNIKRTRFLSLMMLPGILYYIIFHYIPMYGVSIAFTDYKIGTSFPGGEWVGIDHLVRFLTHPYFWRLMRNTFLLNFYSLVWAWPAPIILAIMLNETRNALFRRAVQTISYLPHFISIVSIVSILTLILSPKYGIVNKFIVDILGLDSIYFMASKEWFRTIYIGSGVWQGVGWGAIIYLAAMSGIDVQLYEAAYVDGASRLRRIWHITLPGIKPTVVILLIFQLGSLLSSGFEKIILMYKPTTYQVADVISSYLYRVGLIEREYSYGVAVGLFNSIITIILIVTANRFARKYTEQSLW